MSSNQIELVLKYIKAHPELSGNQIYNYTRQKGFGIAKQTFYDIFRKERKIKKRVKVVKKEKPKIIKKPKVIVKKEKPKVVVKKIPIRTVQKKITKTKRLTQKDKLLSEKLRDLIEYPEDENLEYGLIEVYDKKTKESRWIKYKNKAHLDWQIDILETSDKKKGFSSDYDFIYHGLKDYTPFFAPEFLAIIEKMGT